MTSPAPSDLAARIGLDWADEQHDVSFRETGSPSVERSQVPHTPEALTEWLTGLRRRFGGQPVGICLELSRGALIHALLEHDFLVLYPLNPKSLKRFRETFYPSGAKDDPGDADLMRELLEKHRDRLQPWTPDEPEVRALDRLTRARRKAVDLRTRLSQQLRAELKGYFPQALDWVGKLTSPLACDFLLKWPTLESLQRARPETVRKFYYGHNCRRGGPHRGASRGDRRGHAAHHRSRHPRDLRPHRPDARPPDPSPGAEHRSLRGGDREPL